MIKELRRYRMIGLPEGNVNDREGGKWPNKTSR